MSTTKEIHFADLSKENQQTMIAEVEKELYRRKKEEFKNKFTKHGLELVSDEWGISDVFEWAVEELADAIRQADGDKSDEADWDCALGCDGVDCDRDYRFSVTMRKQKSGHWIGYDEDDQMILEVAEL